MRETKGRDRLFTHNETKEVFIVDSKYFNTVVKAQKHKRRYDKSLEGAVVENKDNE